MNVKKKIELPHNLIAVGEVGAEAHWILGATMVEMTIFDSVCLLDRKWKHAPANSRPSSDWSFEQSDQSLLFWLYISINNRELNYLRMNNRFEKITLFNCISFRKHLTCNSRGAWHTL